MNAVRLQESVLTKKGGAMPDNKDLELGVAVLAAGEGQRLRWGYSKPLSPLWEGKLVDYPIQATRDFLKEQNLNGKIGVVLGKEREKVENHLRGRFGEQLLFAYQEKRLGTADALRAYFEGCAWAKRARETLVVCGDSPLLMAGDFKRLWEEKKADGAVATFTAKNPRGYGRIIRQGEHFIIVEEKEATAEQKKVCEVNSGVYLLKTSFVLEALEHMSLVPGKKELYLTDIFKSNADIYPVLFDNQKHFDGVNNLKQLEMAERELNNRKICALREQGVRFLQSESCFVGPEVEIGAGSLIYPNCYLRGKTKIAENCVLEPGCFLTDSELEQGVHLKAYSYLEETLLKKNSTVGPFARLRPKTILGEGGKIGNFVETKQSTIGDHSSVSHLSYVGDARVGSHSNIGCGFITCNYDGEKKHKTTIGDKAFIGSDTQVIAPLRIGDRSYVGSGSTINKDVPDDAFAIARSEQITKKGMAVRFLKGKWSKE